MEKPIAFPENPWLITISGAALPDRLFMPFVENSDSLGQMAPRALKRESSLGAFPEHAALSEKFLAGCRVATDELKSPWSVLSLTVREVETIRLLA